MPTTADAPRSPVPLNQAIAQAGTTAAKLAAQLGVSEVTVARYSSGVREPPVTLALRLAALLGVPVTDIDWAHRRPKD